jgi:hypothetical protein
MKDIKQILQDKQRRIEQLRSEIQALRIVAPLVGDAPADANSHPAVVATAPTGDDLALYLDEPAR